MKKEILKIMVLAFFAAVMFSSCKSVSVLNVRVTYRTDLKDTTYLDTVKYTYETLTKYNYKLVPKPMKSKIKDITYMYGDDILNVVLILENGHIITLSTAQAMTLNGDFCIGKEIVYYDDIHKKVDSVPNFSFRRIIEQKNENDKYTVVSIDTVEFLPIEHLNYYKGKDTTVIYATENMVDDVEVINYNRSTANIACLKKKVKHVDGEKVYQLKMYQKRKNGTWIYAWVNTDENVYNDIVFPSDFCLYDKDWKCRIVKTFPVKYINNIYSTEQTYISITTRFE